MRNRPTGTRVKELLLIAYRKNSCVATSGPQIHSVDQLTASTRHGYSNGLFQSSSVIVHVRSENTQVPCALRTPSEWVQRGHT